MVKTPRLMFGRDFELNFDHDIKLKAGPDFEADFDQDLYTML